MYYPVSEPKSFFDLAQSSSLKKLLVVKVFRQILHPLKLRTVVFFCHLVRALHEERTKIQIATKLLNMGNDIKSVAELAELPQETVEKLAQSISKEEK